LIERTKTSKKKCCYIFINIHHGIGRMHWQFLKTH
jgi:hypothetical protein